MRNLVVCLQNIYEMFYKSWTDFYDIIWYTLPVNYCPDTWICLKSANASFPKELCLSTVTNLLLLGSFQNCNTYRGHGDWRLVKTSGLVCTVFPNAEDSENTAGSDNLCCLGPHTVLSHASLINYKKIHLTCVRWESIPFDI